MNRTIQADLFRYGGLSGTKGLIKGFRKPGFRYMYVFRQASQGGRFSLKRLFFSWLRRRYSYKFGFQIPVGTVIGEGFFIGHHGTIVVNGKARIGKNCNIAHNVTIGQANRGRLEGFPTIGDHVWMGTGAVIVGNIHIGNNVLIAPNAYVNMDVPENSLVLGNPAKIIPKENPCDGYINNIL